jgi:hypothetical protein
MHNIVRRFVREIVWLSDFVHEFEIGSDSYRTGNRMCTKSYADSFTDSYARLYVYRQPLTGCTGILGHGILSENTSNMMSPIDRGGESGQ